MVSRLQCGRSSRLISHSADYLHLTKRFGIVAASQLPFHYLLIWKSSWSPIQTLTRTSHETLNVYHQVLGRIVTLLVFLHAAFYLNFYVQNNILGSKLKEAYVLCGIAGTIAFAAIGTTALSPVRRWSYRIFYAVHVILSIALLPALFFHVHHIRIYLYETAAVYALNYLTRGLSVSPRSGTIRSIPNTSLVEISIPCNARDSGQRLFTNYRPGQHAYVSLARNPLSRTFHSNPLTAVSMPGTDKHLKFVARALDGNTRKLATLAAKNSAGIEVNLNIEGPHGLGSLEDRLLQYDRVLFVAGGVGATFVLPLYRQLLADLSPNKGSYRRQKVTFVWIARSESEVTWAVPTDQREKEGFVERLKVCITGASAPTPENGMDYNDGATAAADVDDGNDGIELEEQKQLLADNNEPTAAPKDLPIHTGRPDLRRLVHQAFSHGSNERVAIITCGPKSLSQNLRREIAPWVTKRGRDVWYHDESFSL